jgi:hypothetical protein
MTPEEKAKELMRKCRTVAPYAMNDTIAKRAAMIVCEEAIACWPLQPTHGCLFGTEYWKQVKSEIDRL